MKFPNIILTLSALVLGGSALHAQGVAGNGSSQTAANETKWEFPSKAGLPRIEELPDPFIKPDGSRVQTPDEWPEQREYLKALLAHYFYGTMPPAPHNTTGEVLYTRRIYGGRALAETIRITFGPDDRPDCKVSFIAEVTRPNIEGRVPVITWNQYKNKYHGCPIEEELVCNRCYAIIEFEKEQLAADSPEAMNGPLAKAYPGYTWGCIAMWSWGHSRLIDYLETTDYADMGKIVSTGHSRGGKIAECAAIYDERIAVCAANATGSGGTGCFRFLGSRLGEGYGIVETAGSTMDDFPYWWADEFGEFGKRQTNLNHETMMEVDMAEVKKSLVRYTATEALGDEAYLPFDQHYVRALIAPRGLITTEQTTPAWYNQYGVLITWIASDEVFQFLGADRMNALHSREGQHSYKAADWTVMADFCDMVFFGKEPESEFLTSPSVSDPGNMKGSGVNLHYSWRRPGAQ